MDNMEIYNRVRKVPDNAQKTIKGGRLIGMTDINPMWRIQALTEQFGPCGIGWKYVIREKRIENGPNGEIATFVDIDLYYKTEETWSEAIPGTGGSAFVAKESRGLYVSDECFKMALTDALSVACKALGMGADVYWAAGRTKYDSSQIQNDTTPMMMETCSDCRKPIVDSKKRDGSDWLVQDIVSYSTKRFGRCLCPSCQRKAFQAEKESGQ